MQTVPCYKPWPAPDTGTKRSEKLCCRQGGTTSPIGNFIPLSGNYQLTHILKEQSLYLPWNHTIGDYYVCRTAKWLLNFLQVLVSLHLLANSFPGWIFSLSNLCCNFSITEFSPPWQVPWLGNRTTQFTFTQLLLSLPSP